MKAPPTNSMAPTCIILKVVYHCRIMADKRIYVERRDEGDYAVRRAGSQRASDVKPTQKEAIDRAKELAPGVNPHVERVRHTDAGGPDKWRKS